jgi:uncharacterized protein (TIGR02246 family)
MRRLALAVLSLVFLAACQPATTELTEEQRAEIEAEVSAANAELHDTWSAVDFDRAMSPLYDSPNAAWGFQGEIDFGREAIAAKWRPYFETLSSQSLTVTESRVSVLAPTVVCINEIITATATDTAGVAGPEQIYAVTTVWVRDDGEWKVHTGHESLLPTEPM